MSVAQLKTIKQTIQTSAEGYPLLGYAIYWSINDVHVRYNDFLQMLDNVDLPTDVATAVQSKSALIKAIKADTKGRKNAFHRGVVDNEAKASFAIVSSATVDEDNVEVEFQTETKVTLNKGDKTLDVSGPNAATIREAFESFKDTYTSDRFRNVVLKLVKGHLQGMSIRERGGVYFVPASHNDMFDKLQALFAMFPTCTMDVIPVIDTAQAKQSMWKTFVHGITEELSKAKEDMQTLEPDASGRSLQVRLDRYQSLRDKVENYEILLNGTASDLKAELISLGVEIRKRME
jgi:hypothetical protein